LFGLLFERKPHATGGDTATVKAVAMMEMMCGNGDSIRKIYSLCGCFFPFTKTN